MQPAPGGFRGQELFGELLAEMNRKHPVVRIPTDPDCKGKTQGEKLPLMETTERFIDQTPRSLLPGTRQLRSAV